MKNNIVVNTSTAAGTGFTAAFRFASTTLNTYALTSNNNDFYAGTPGATNVIYYDGTNSDQTMAAFKTRVAPRESQTVTEIPPFISITPGTMNLHINAATATQVESSGLVVSTPNINTDFDNDPRYPNAGFPVNLAYPPTAPDMGADEFGGIPLDLTGPAISYSPLLNTSVLTNRTLVATITDMHGVPTSGAGLPRLAWKKFYNGTWSYVTGTSLGSNQYSFSFGSGVVLNDSVYYYVLAQDAWTTPNVGTNPAVGAGGFTTTPPAAATAPATPFKYKIIPGICGSFNVGVGQTYATLTAAIADVAAKDLTCPVTLVLTDNTYPSEIIPIIIPQLPGASAANTLTIKPAPGVTPSFTATYTGASPNYWSMISLNGAQWVIFDGSNSGGSDRSMTFKNSGPSGYNAPIGLYNNGTIGASNITVKNCVLQANKDPLYNSQAFAMYNITGNAGFRNIILNNNSINSAKYGIDIMGIATGKATNIQVTNNTIGSNTDANAIMQFGIQITNADSVLIEGNEIIGAVNGNLTNAQAVMGIYVGSSSTNLKIRKNTFHDWYGGGNSALGIYYGAEANTVCEISDNVMYTIKSPGYTPNGIYVQSGGNIHIYHNSIFLGGNTLSATVAVTSACIGTANNVSLLDIRDNILKNSLQPVSGTPASKSYAISVGTNVTGCTYNYNDYFVDGIGPNIGSLAGVDQTTFANWQAATAQEANSLNIDPVFTGATNLLPTTAAMPHAGLYFSSVQTDVTGANRTNPPDMGAYEFTTNPLINTTSASLITYNSATLNGSANAKGTTFSLFFDWGLTTAYGTSVAASPASVTGNTLNNMLVGITGLSGNTTYHYRARGVTSGGLVVYGFDMTFTTAPNPPAVVTTAATAVTSAGATLNGTVNSNGGTSTVNFEYGLTTAYGTTVIPAQSPVTGSLVNAVNYTISGLLPNTLYHYRVNATNAGGTTNGNDMTFTTSPILAVVVTNLANPVGSTTATLNGTVTANNAATTVTFQYGLTVAYGNTVSATPGTANGMTGTAVLANLTGLIINSTYHFRCVGVNAAGTTYGADQIFATNCVAPVITITGAATTCSGTSGYVYTTETGMSSYVWNISAGGTITAGAGTSSVTVTWNTAGAQTLSVNYNNTFGCSAPAPLVKNVTVNASPAPTISGSSTACVNWTNNTYSTETGQTGYVWTVSAGGTITAGQGTSAITVTWTTTGAKTVTANYANASGCLAPSATVLNVTVNALPAPTVTGQNSVCANSGYISYTTEAGMSNYVWTVSAGGAIASGQGTSTLEVTWTSTGAQTVTVNYANANGCAALTPTSYNVTVNGAPATAGTITGTATVCGGAQGIAYSVAPVTGALAYAWTVPTGATIASGANTNAITVNFAGNASSGNITVAGNNLCGNGNASPNFAVTVNALPANAGTITGDASVCLGSTGHVYSVPVIANATNYTWSLPAGATITSGQNSSSITVTYGTSAVSGNVTVLGVNSCGNGTVSPNFAVTTHPIPAAPVVTATGNVLTSSAPAGNQWYYEGVIIPGATGQTYTVTHNTGYYSCEVTLSGCSSPVSNRVWVVMTAIEQLQGSNFNIYPVPNDGKFTVSLASPVQDTFTITVFTSLGVQVREVKDIEVNGRFDQEIDLRPASDGVYMVVIRNGSNHVVKKVIVNK
ncbi:MAG: T9SS type A sorting domain-containing protein [Bacteroidota bacterium]